MDLTQIERLLLANQFRILARLDSDDAERCTKMVEILECGYAREYPLLVRGFSKELSARTSEEVVDILHMHRDLHDGYIALEDKSGIGADEVSFEGFDGNSEGEHLGYASFLIHRLGHWQEFSNAGDGLNSHHPTLHRYRPMLARWKASADQHRLTREDIIRIVKEP
jgi:uncharacterized protein YfbU (UPF0304 family)